MRTDLLHLASDLARRGEAFVLATVVRREPPSSARVGDAALVTQGARWRPLRAVAARILWHAYLAERAA